MENEMPVPRLISSPSIPGVVAPRTIPSTVSATKVRSRRGDMAPSFTVSPDNAWVTTVGMNARADCRGPNVLNGRMTTTGVSNDR